MRSLGAEYSKAGDDGKAGAAASRGLTPRRAERSLYAAPSLCGKASATRETFPTFPVVLSPRAVDPTPVGPRLAFPLCFHRDARLPVL